jgi:hypothetical protein
VHAITGRNILLALLLSLFMTLVIAVFHTFSPVIAAILSLLWRGIVSRGPETNGVVAVAGGVSESFLKVLVLVAPILFFIILALLHKRSLKH